MMAEPRHRGASYRLLGGLAAVVVLALITVLSIWSVLPPAAVGASAAAEDFSAERAFGHVERIGSDVHVTGSAAADRVRGHVVDTLAGLGLEPTVQDTVGAMDALGGPALARVRNVVAEIPGTDPTGRIILMAHYDSVQVSYGANDDGAGTSTLLETARALLSGPPLRNDVLLLFTDAEEACLCGAAAFVADDVGPDGRSPGGIVLNVEARGTGGPAVMFETSVGNADLVGQYAQAVPYPVATSLAVEVYRILPNDTDFTPFRLSGDYSGFNTAYIDGVAAYHSPQDRPENMNVGTLQALGANTLALTRQLGDADISVMARPGGADATYFPLWGRLIHYPGALVWPLAVLSLLLVALLAGAVRRRREVGWGRLAAGFGLAVIPLVGAAAAAQGLWALLVAIRPGYGAMIDPWRPGWYRMAVIALVLLVLTAWYALLRRRFTPWVLAVGGFGWLAVVAVVMAATVPGGSYLAALPAIVGACAGIVATARQPWWTSLISVTVAAGFALLVLAPTVLLFFPALGLATGAAPALFAAMAGLALIPVLEYLHPAVTGDGQRPPRARTAGPRRWSGRGAVVVTAAAAVLFTVIGLVVDRFDAQHPQPTQLMYALDADTGDAHWVSEQDDPIGWTAQYLTGTEDLSDRFPLLPGPLPAGPAPAAPLPPPTMEVVADRQMDGTRELTVVLHPRPGARLVTLTAVDAQILFGAVDGRAVPQHPGPFQLEFHGPPPEGVTVDLVVDGPGPVTFRITDGSDGLSHLPGFVPRPPDVGVQGSHTSELAMVGTTVTR